jgi:hypothetical protein
VSSEKQRKVIYMTEDDQARLDKRMKKLSTSATAYISELMMWDNQLGLIEACREGLLDIKEARPP